MEFIGIWFVYIRAASWSFSFDRFCVCRLLCVDAWKKKHSLQHSIDTTMWSANRFASDDDYCYYHYSNDYCTFQFGSYDRCDAGNKCNVGTLTHKKTEQSHDECGSIEFCSPSQFVHRFRFLRKSQHCKCTYILQRVHKMDDRLRDHPHVQMPEQVVIFLWCLVSVL